MLFDAIILAKGDYPSSEWTRRVLSEASFLCCCDDAAEEYIRRESKTPDAIVGDGDSLTQEFKEKYRNIYHVVLEQDYNDLTKATRFCMSRGYKRICYLGATGMREDHTIGNIALLTFYKREFDIEPVMITDYGTFMPCRGRSVFHSFPHQQISIFNVSCTHLSSEGLKWHTHAFHELWQGTLNEALSDSFKLDADGEYIVYLTHQAKGTGI